MKTPLQRMCDAYNAAEDDGVSNAPHYWSRLSSEEKDAEKMRAALRALVQWARDASPSNYKVGTPESIALANIDDCGTRSFCGVLEAINRETA